MTTRREVIALYSRRRQIGVGKGPDDERKRLVSHLVASALRIACGVAGMSMWRMP